MWFEVCGLWFVVCGVWCVVCGLRSVICVLWFMFCGLRFGVWGFRFIDLAWGLGFVAAAIALRAGEVTLSVIWVAYKPDFGF